MPIVSNNSTETVCTTIIKLTEIKIERIHGRLTPMFVDRLYPPVYATDQHYTMQSELKVDNVLVLNNFRFENTPFMPPPPTNGLIYLNNSIWTNEVLFYASLYV